MAEEKYYPPELLADKFHCPHCKALAKQNWGGVQIQRNNAPAGATHIINELRLQPKNWIASQCDGCGEIAFWREGQMIYPDVISVPSPNEDLNKEIQRDYWEASQIVNKSPRGASALLRLAIQKLCSEVGGSGEHIASDIDYLMEKGLPVGVKEALDGVRVIGNESVHPGELDMRDDIDTAYALFDLINFIAEKMLTEPRKVKELYSKVPESKKR